MAVPSLGKQVLIDYSPRRSMNQQAFCDAKIPIDRIVVFLPPPFLLIFLMLAISMYFLSLI